MRTFYKPGNIGDDEALLLRPLAYDHHPQVRLEGGKRVVGNLGARGGDRGDQSGLTDIRIPHQTDISEQLQFQAKGAFFAWPSLFMFARGLVGRGGKLRIASSAATAVSHDDA